MTRPSRCPATLESGGWIHAFCSLPAGHPEEHRSNDGSKWTDGTEPHPAHWHDETGAGR